MIRFPQNSIPFAILTASAIVAFLLSASTAQEVSLSPQVATRPSSSIERRTTTLPTTRRVNTPASQPLTRDAADRVAAELRLAYGRPVAEWPAPEVDPSVKPIELGLLPEPQHPTNNPFSKEKADLGRELFFEPKLSGSGQFACASCHNPELGWSDGTSLSFGHDRQNAKRNAPTIQNVAFKTHYFWDGRAGTLEDQVLIPLTADNEMHGDPVTAVDRLGKTKTYPRLFKAAFGDEAISIERIQQAIACFERQQVGGRSDFDRFLRGRTTALSDEAVRGLHLFRTKAGCLNCHSGPNFTDNQFHNVGLSYYGRKLQDLGRYEITKKPEDVGAFLTPGLRNVERTAPYMHNGLFDLDGVLNLYNAGMPTLRRLPKYEGDPLFPTKSPLLKPLRLNPQEIADLKAFLLSLTEPRQRVVRTEDPE
ncbi:MAG: cytochrome c peroxidase [Tepidisphaeraceae bacterium]